MIGNLILRYFGLAAIVASAIAPINAVFASPLLVDVRTLGAKGDGVTDDTVALNAAIAAGIKLGPGATVYLPKGTYRIATLAGGPKSLSVDGADHLTIEGQPGTVILVGSSATAFNLSNSTHLTISHLTVDHNPLEFTQGTVIAVNAAASTCDVAIEKGYDDLDAAQFAKGVAFKPFIYPGADTYQQDHYIPSVDTMERIGAGTWRFHFKSNGVIEDWTGKPCLMTAPEAGWCFAGRNLDNWTVDDVSYWGGGGQAAWYLVGLTGATTFHHFLVTVPPGSDRLYCCAGGGQISGLRGTLLIEDSEFKRIDDDCLDVLASWNRVVAQPGPRILSVQHGGYLAGDHIQLWDWVQKKSRVEAVVTAVAPAADAAGQILTLDRDVTAGNVGPGVGPAFGRDADADGIDRVIDLDTTGTQTVVRNCIYQDFRAKCLNLKAQNCTVENCTFFDSWQSPISASPEWYFEEGPNVTHLTVRNCTFTNCVHSNIEVGTVTTAQMPPPSNIPSPEDHPELYGHETMDVVLENNTFSNYGAHLSDYPFVPIGDAIRVVNASNVTIRGNKFGKPGGAVADSPKLIVIGCTNVNIEGNKNIDPADIEQK